MTFFSHASKSDFLVLGSLSTQYMILLFKITLNITQITRKSSLVGILYLFPQMASSKLFLEYWSSQLRHAGSSLVIVITENEYFPL